MTELDQDMAETVRPEVAGQLSEVELLRLQVEALQRDRDAAQRYAEDRRHLQEEAVRCRDQWIEIAKAAGAGPGTKQARELSDPQIVLAGMRADTLRYQRRIEHLEREVRARDGVIGGLAKTIYMLPRLPFKTATGQHPDVFGALAYLFQPRVQHDHMIFDAPKLAPEAIADVIKAHQDYQEMLGYQLKKINGEA